MAKLHQILALEKTRKAQAKQKGDEIDRRLQKHQLADGGYGNYQPAQEDGVQLQAERQLVQLRADMLLAEYAASQVPAWDITATKDTANMSASSDVVLPDGTSLGSLPVTTLIFLEKQVTDLRTLISRAPVLDPGESWQFNASTGLSETAPVTTVRTQKVVRHEVVVPPTDKHPAQVAQIPEDVPAGAWTRVKQSGALQATRRQLLLDRCTTLIEALKSARESANEAEAGSREIGDAVFSWVLRTASPPSAGSAS